MTKRIKQLKTPEKEDEVETTKEIPTNYTKDITVKKIWNDNENEKEKRPESVTLKLTGDSKEYKVTLTRENIMTNQNEWVYTFENLPKYNAQGEEIEYILTEEPIDSPFYTEGNTSIDQEAKTVTNTFEIPNETMK